MIASSVVLPQSEAFLLASSFVPPSTSTPPTQTGAQLQQQTTTQLCGSASSFDDDMFDTQLLEERLTEMRRHLYEQELRRPPNPELSPQQFVSELLLGLYDNADPLPDSGFRLLLRASTRQWRRQLHRAVGAPATAQEETVASALGQAMGRPHNQFGILVGEGERFRITFPSDPVDYADGTCWLECRLRDAQTDHLLVVSGWQLQQRASDGAWLVDKIDWQDFRDEFRPGIGREEWMRICG